MMHGEDALTGYRFGKLTREHRFCTTCGIEVFEVLDQNVDVKAINVRTIDGIDLKTLRYKMSNGKEE